LAALQSPTRDVQDLDRVLRTTGRYTVTTFLDGTGDQARREIDGFFRTAASADDLNLLYLSCHGVQDAKGRLYFAFSDTDCNLLDSTAVSAEWVRDRIQTSRSTSTLVLVDCCFSGKFLKGMQVRSTGTGVEALVQDLPRSSGVSVLTASGPLEASFEDKTGDRPSYFTGAIVEGLDTGAADLNRDGRITDDELYEYAYAHLLAGTSPQRPRRLFAGEGSLVVADAGSARRPTARPAPPHRRLRRTAIAVAAAAGLVAAGTALAASDLPGRSAQPEPAPSSVDTTPGPALSGGTISASPNASAPAPSGPAVEAPSLPITSTTSTRVTPKAAQGAAPAAGAALRSAATFASPANGAPVKHCSYFTGTARLADGETLILASRNLSNGQPNRYVEQVFGWQQPQNLGSWRGHQYFDAGAVGQRFQIQVIAVDLDDVQAAYNGTAEDFNALADRGTVLASREVERIDGTVPGDCEGP
jgi:hypothetical protein